MSSFTRSAPLHEEQDERANPWSGEVLIFPATVAQQRFWALDREDPGNPAYNIAIRFRLVGPLQRENMERAFNAIVQRQESLRTIFAMSDGALQQVVAPEMHLALPVVDLRDIPADDRLARSEDLTVEEARRRFHLGEGPLIRAKLLRMEDEEHILLVTVHQMVSDCWSSGMISQELGAHYNAICSGGASPLPDLPIQYGDYAIWQQEWLEQSAFGEQLDYWTKELANLPTLEIPTDRPRPRKKTSNGHIESVLLPKDLTDDLKELSHQEGCTFFMLSLAALNILIQRHSGKNDIFVGTVTAGRSRTELEPLIGRFINPLIIRANLADDPTFLQLLERVRDKVVTALENRDVPYERVAEAIGAKPDPSRHPVFQINFVHQRAFLKPLQVAGLSVSPIPSKSAGAIYDLYFFMVERAEGWRLSCEFNTDLYDANTVRRMLDHYRVILEEASADPSKRISEIQRPTRAEAAPPVCRADTPRPPRRVRSNEYVPPADETEARMAEIWQRVLKVKTLSVTSDFFDEGGHSVLAARLLVAIEEAFGRKFTIATLLRASTIRKFAAKLQQDEPDAKDDLVHPIQPEGSRLPLFVVTSQPPLYRDLAECLGPDQPVIGLAWPDIPQVPNPFTVEDVARVLIESMRQVQPRGPYHLSGWCMSGVIAYEMAQQLKAAGEEVAALVLFDSYNPVYVKRFRGLKGMGYRSYFLIEKMVYHLSKARTLPRGEALAYARRRVSAILKRWSEKFQPRGSQGTPSTLVDDIIHLVELKTNAVATYVPMRYDGPVVLTRSAVLQTGRFRDPHLGWDPVTGDRLVVHEMAGEHSDMFREPVVEHLASILSPLLSQNRTEADVS